MDILLRCLVVLALLIAVPGTVNAQSQTKPAAPASSETDDSVLHIFMCELGPGVTEEQADALAQVKFKALKQMPGAEEATMNILWPVAVTNTGQVDFWVVWTFPTFSDWGRFWDAYEDSSPVAREDDATEGKVDCPDSMIWEAHEIALPK